MTSRVLVVDDEPPVRALIARILSRHGYDVDDAADGQEAIEKIDAGPYDAIVLDLMMPKIDGFGVISHLAEHRPEMVAKIVVATAFPRAALDQRIHHVCHVISKPFEITELLQNIAECAGELSGPALSE